MINEIPKYNEMYNEFLEILEDKKEHTINEIRNIIARNRNISTDALNLTLESGYSLFNNRVGWTGTYLKKAGLIESNKRGIFCITNSGLNVLNKKIIITNEYLMNFKDFADFKKGNKDSNINAPDTDEQKTPQELIEQAIDELNKDLSDQLLSEIIKRDSYFFEKLSVQLINAMGYGKKENSIVTQRCRDNGIDGIVLDDELGINNIMIQSKKYDIGNNISRPEVQKFAGALLNQKNVKRGVFITTSSFTREAIDYAEAVGLILINGKRLANLMIKYNVGCTIQNIYEVKNLDIDFFEGA